MSPPAKRVRVVTTLPNVTVRRLVQYMPHDTYLYLYKINREPACCQQSAFGVCIQCDAVRDHAARMWPCFEAGRSLSDCVVNGILELHLHMQLDSDYEPAYLGGSIAQAHEPRGACRQHNK
jgi:hypothetical protein